MVCALLKGLSQSVHYPVAAQYTGSGAYSKNFIDVFSFTSNQGALAGLQQVSAGIYAERKFLLKELSVYNLAVALPTTVGGIGFTAKYFGSTDYNESLLGIAYAKNLGKIDIGAQFNYNMIRIAGYGNDAVINFELGTIWHITDKFHTGIHVYNPVGGKFGKSGDEKLAAVYKGGFGYEASQKVFLSTEIIKEEDKPVNVRAGLQYNFAEAFFVRTGISTNAAFYYLGAGLSWKNVRLDVTASYHSQLGITPGLLLIFAAKPKDEQ